MTTDYYQSFKYKAALVGNAADVAIIQIVLWKKHNICYSIKVSKQLLKIPETIPAKVINNYTNTYDLITPHFKVLENFLFLLMLKQIIMNQL